MPTPMLWNETSVKLGPVWQAEQCPLPKKTFMPRWAASERAVLSPALKRS